ncbi:hypothetical protein C9374_004939 [Naegleria lovaniensis]|uniref:Elongator complex protein 6 n=1 Tax=Naegleria lovaniensis TaxID=51637 RepID=A0AA88GRF9_NAELO|nr:uncharacterized protein C9374_004939 [Naegleria lovaniensis]KAG2382972.1 hypothetical protein C9374_004939 [Naegleria lovaniensis]
MKSSSTPSPSSSNGVIFTELNTSMKWHDKYIPENQLIFVKDGTTSSDGGFLIHHYMNSFFNHGKRVFLCSFNQSFFHYNTIELKLNINLEKEAQEGKFVFVDAQQSFLFEDINVGNDSENLHNNLLLYSSPLLLTKSSQQQAPSCIVSLKSTASSSIEEYLSHLFKTITNLEKEPSCIILDHINPLLHQFYASDSEGESVVNRQILKFITKLRKQFQNVTIVVLMFSSVDKANTNDSNMHLSNMLEHMSDVVFRVGPLPTGYSKDVHGRVECIASGSSDDGILLKLPKKATLHFKTFESKVSLFVPGSVSTSSHKSDSFLF